MQHLCCYYRDLRQYSFLVADNERLYYGLNRLEIKHLSKQVQG